jgi:DNA-binding transcriptional ArsR family regulator
VTPGAMTEGAPSIPTTVSAVRGAGLEPDQRLATVLTAVGEPNRLRLLRLLLDGERCVTQCVEHTGLVQSLVSKHLGRLADAGLVQRRPAGPRSYHSVVDPAGLREMLDAAARLAQLPPPD